MNNHKWKLNKMLNFKGWALGGKYQKIIASMIGFPEAILEKLQSCLFIAARTKSGWHL